VTTFADLYGGPVPAALKPAALKQPTAPPKKAKPKRWFRGEWQDALFDMLESGPLTHLEFAVGVYLSRRADNETGECWPSIRTIAGKVHARVDSKGGSSSVTRAIAKLKKLGLLQVRQRLNISNFYTLTPLDSPAVDPGTPPLQRRTISVKRIPPLTESGNSFEGATKPTIELDGEMRSIAIDSKVDDWAVEGEFKQWITGNEKKGVRLHHPKEAWRGWCKKYKREIGRDFEGNPEWCPELLTVAIANGIPDEREAVRWFYKALKKRERMRKGKKREPVHNVVGWWRVASKGWHEDHDRQEARRARRDDD
jgi:hypothetical protein